MSVYEKNNITSLSGHLNPFISNFFSYIKHQTIKEELYITAINNLNKKNEFLQLSTQLDNEIITNEEFDNELELNEGRYLIKINNDFNEEHFRFITEILPKLDRPFSSDEVSEMFSAPIDDVNHYLDSFTHQQHPI